MNPQLSSIEICLTETAKFYNTYENLAFIGDSAGLDLRACFSYRDPIKTDTDVGTIFPFAVPSGDGTNTYAIAIEPGETATIPSGIHVWIKDPNFFGMVVPRSSIGHKRGLVLGNGTGIIDADYQGEILLSMFNRTNRRALVHRGERICQMLIVPVIRPSLKIVSSFDEVTARGTGGFGSTGTK